MGKNADFSREEVRFLVQCFEKGWTDKDIKDEIRDAKEYPPRAVRTIGKIRKIYEVVEQVQGEKSYEAAKKSLKAVWMK